MHELSLAENIIQLVEQTAADQGAGRVKTVFVEIGRLAQVDVDALSFAFEVVSRGGCAAGAEFRVIDIPGLARCEDCQAQVPLEAMATACPQCGSYRLQVIAGQEMRVKGIAIDC